MAVLAKYLDLSPSFGGTRFGPFDAPVIRIGSDAALCDVTVPAALGAVDLHVQVLEEADGRYLLSPMSHTAPVYLFRGDRGVGVRVTGPTAMVAGDAFSLATPEGPRFALRVPPANAPSSRAPTASAPSARSGWGLPRGIAEELQRRGLAAMVTTQLGHVAMRAFAFVRTGQFLRPITLVSGLLMLSGWLFGGATWLRFGQLATGGPAQRLADCQDQLATARASGTTREPTLAEIAGRVLGDPTLSTTLQLDRALAEAFTRHLDTAQRQASTEAWRFTEEQGPHATLREALVASMPAALAEVLAFQTVRSSWRIVQNGEGSDVCGRGPMALTYRHALRLGLAARPDALVSAAVAGSGDIAAQTAAVAQTRAAAGQLGDESDELVFRGAEVQGGRQCLHAEGLDERTDSPAVAAALTQRLGASASGLPAEGASGWLAARVMAVFADDYDIDPSGLVFASDTPPSASLQLAEVSRDRQRLTVERAGELLARAATGRCEARLQLGADRVPAWFTSDVPGLADCAILAALSSRRD